MNKMLTVTANVLIWDKHASLSGIGSLAMCLLGGSLYQQAPLRDGVGKAGDETRALRSGDGEQSDASLSELTLGDERDDERDGRTRH